MDSYTVQCLKLCLKLEKIIKRSTVHNDQKIDHSVSIQQPRTFTSSICATSIRRRSLILTLQESVFQMLFALTVLLYTYRRLRTFRRNSLPPFSGNSSNLAHCFLSIPYRSYRGEILKSYLVVLLS
jgi:hypothetical protein